MTYYRERLWPSAWIYLALGLVIPAALLVFLPINQLAGVITAAVLYLGGAAILVVTSPVIAVTDSGLVAGRATMPLNFIGDLSAYSGTDASLQRGQKLDARAWMLIRGWIAPIVKIEITDPEDPTPYWILSTRRPSELLAAITAARQETRRGTAN